MRSGHDVKTARDTPRNGALHITPRNGAANTLRNGAAITLRNGAPNIRVDLQPRC